MARATYVFEVDWDNDKDYADTGEDLTARTFRLDWVRGRDYASQLTGKSIGSRLTAIIDNTSGDYNSLNGTGPLSGKILPGRRVRLRSTAPVAATLWTGRLENINPHPQIGAVNVVELNAIGPLAYVNLNKVSIALQSDIATGAAIDAILDEISWDAADRAVDSGQTLMAKFEVDVIPVVDALRQVEETEAGFITESRDGKIVFEDRHHRLKGSHLVSQGTFSDSVNAEVTYRDINQVDPLPHIFNRFEATVNRYKADTGGTVVLWTLAQGDTESPVIRFGETRDFWALYPGPSSPAGSHSVDTWTTPVATTDYLTNSQADGLGTNLTSSMAISVKKQSRRMKISVTNNHATLSAFLTFLQARGTGNTKEEPFVISSEDTGSQAAYGVRLWPVPALWISQEESARNYILFLMRIYGQPLPIEYITVLGHRDTNHLGEVLVRDISERVTLYATSDRTGLGVTSEMFIENEHHTITRNREHTVTYGLSPLDGYSGFTVMDTALLGQDSALAY